MNNAQGFQYFSSLRVLHYWTIFMNILYNTLKSGGTIYYFNWVKIPGTTLNERLECLDKMELLLDVFWLPQNMDKFLKCYKATGHQQPLLTNRCSPGVAPSSLEHAHSISQK